MEVTGIEPVSDTLRRFLATLGHAPPPKSNGATETQTLISAVQTQCLFDWTMAPEKCHKKLFTICDIKVVDVLKK